MEFKNINQLKKGCGKINVIKGVVCGEVKWGKVQLCPECKAKLQTLQQVCEEIKEFKGEEYTDFEIWEDIKKELLKKFQGEEE